MAGSPNNTFFDREPGGREAAPGSLALVQAFVNTRAREGRFRWEEFDGTDSLRSWFIRKGLLEEGISVEEEDVVLVREVREALRSLLIANNGGKVASGAISLLNQASERAKLVVRFASEGSMIPEVEVGGVDGAIGQVLAAVYGGMRDGTWEQLKACEGCHWAFYDRSRNHSGRWCSMDLCGNRNKTRDYRNRTASRDKNTATE